MNADGVRVESQSVLATVPTRSALIRLTTPLSSLVCSQPPVVHVSSPPTSPSASKTFNAPVARRSAAASPWFDEAAHEDQARSGSVSPAVTAAEDDEANPWN